MGSGLSNNDPLIVSAFHRALLHQGFIVLAIVAVVAICWNLLRSAQLRQAVEGAKPPGETEYHEAAGRRILRVGFGLLWIFDAVLQGQSSMPLGLTSSVIQPGAVSSPGWVQHVTNAGVDVWSFHPVGAAAAAVWIQAGIGVWLLAAPRGNWSRVGGVASAGWGLVIWVFGEAFGAIFAPGLTWLFGAPGAVLFYVVAGILIALPDRVWTGPRMGRWLLRGMGAFFVGMGLLQAWPGRGFWQGGPGGLSAMVHQMAQTPQPHFLASWVSAFASFDAAHGWAVNLFCVIALVSIGSLIAFSRRPGVVRGALVAAVVLCLADWVLVEDLGFLGGVGTDPNSMIPILLLLFAGYVAWVRPASAPVQDAVEVSTWRKRLAASPAYAFRTVAALGAVAITAVGAAPMAVAAADRRPDPIISEAVDGSPTKSSLPAPAFALEDQTGLPVSLSSLHGKKVALTFLDPVCTSDCPTIAQEFRQADRLLGPAADQVEFVAINLNPRYLSADYLTAFDQQESLQGLPNWRFLTGPLPDLEAAWRAYGVFSALAPGGAMVAHTDVAFVIDTNGVLRYNLNSDPGPGTKAVISSFAGTLRDAINNA
jgi:cytochrome oxidase Cu insertion factor (SCO1/SenC/PrrC family)